MDRKKSRYTVPSTRYHIPDLEATLGSLSDPAARSRLRGTLLSICIGLLLGWYCCSIILSGLRQDRFYDAHPELKYKPGKERDNYLRCRSLQLPAGPPADFHRRTESDRLEAGVRPTLIKNAKIWTGSKNGTEVIHGDILLHKGLIAAVGRISRGSLDSIAKDLQVVDVGGSWVTPGIVDLHSHLGDASSPELNGAVDDNSIHGTAQPWLRSLDGLNTHDDSYALSVAGGLTTALVLPGSANAIGGQAYVIKLRKTAMRSPSSMVVEPPSQVNHSFGDVSSIHPPRWRHMKHACGENPSNVYQDTRMDTLWAFRQAYKEAHKIKTQQDEYCAGGLYHEAFPENLQWEALVDVLRGRVKVQIHCYEAVDLDALVRLSNEFQFPISAFHHASEAYLVPEVLKEAYGQPPAIALFATNARYKREAYRGSEFAPKILSENGIKVVMKSDHPVLNSRYLLHEAQQAFFYGLPENLALAAVTTTPAETMGMGHRLGYVKEGWDADLVVWDSHPLALGATPTQVFIDGIPQLESPHVVRKPDTFQSVPKVPDFDKYAKEVIKHDGLPPLAAKKASSDLVLFTNVTSVYAPIFVAKSSLERQNIDKEIRQMLPFSNLMSPQVVLTNKGVIVCFGTSAACLLPGVTGGKEPLVVNLEGGSLSPGLLSFGSPLGLENINQESSTNDGDVFDPLTDRVPTLIGGGSSMVRALDGLLFGTRDALLAYRAGVTSAVTAPSHSGLISGLGTAFSTSAPHKLANGAIIKDVTAVHVSIRPGGRVSVSTQIAFLRRLLFQPYELVASEHEAELWDRVCEGSLPLVVEAHSTDIIATLISMKRELEEETGMKLRLTITGASEAHLLATELGENDIGVIVNPTRPFPAKWENRRILPGPPITKDSLISKLLASNVTVGVGVPEIWAARNTRFDIAWASLEADGRISKEDAIAMASVNLEKLLGVDISSVADTDLVATAGGDLLDMSSKVVAVISPRRGVVDLV